MKIAKLLSHAVPGDRLSPENQAPAPPYVLLRETRSTIVSVLLRKATGSLQHGSFCSPRPILFLFIAPPYF